MHLDFQSLLKKQPYLLPRKPQSELYFNGIKSNSRCGREFLGLKWFGGEFCGCCTCLPHDSGYSQGSLCEVGIHTAEDLRCQVRPDLIYNGAFIVVFVTPF